MNGDDSSLGLWPIWVQIIVVAGCATGAGIVAYRIWKDGRR